VIEHGELTLSFDGERKPKRILIAATHGFTWLPVSNYQRRTNCRHAKKLPASNDGKFHAQKNCIAEKNQRLANSRGVRLVQESG
jgi:hypothetical protein